jgi:hypothetical protein
VHSGAYHRQFGSNELVDSKLLRVRHLSEPAKQASDLHAFRNSSGRSEAKRIAARTANAARVSERSWMGYVRCGWILLVVVGLAVDEVNPAFSSPAEARQLLLEAQ